jgi:hypothetical protein
MGSVRAADIRQLMIGGREFDPKGDSNVDYKLAGFENESSANGNGSMHTTQKRKLGGFESLPISIDQDRGDLEYLQDLANKGEPVPMFMTTATQSYGGDLVIQGTVNANTGEGTAEISALGPNFQKL